MGDFIKNVVVPVMGLITACLAAWVNCSVANVKSELDAQKAHLDEQLQMQQASLEKLTTERNLRKADEDLTFRVYDAVTTSLLSDNAKQQRVVSALVIALVEEPLRTRFLQVFDQSEATSQEVRTEVAQVLATEQSFRQEEAVVKAAAPTKPVPSPAASAWGEWDVDVFWCERSGAEARAASEKIVGALKEDGAKGRLRSRLLPDSINAQGGYRLRGFVIRRDPGEEERAAALQALAQRALEGASFEVTPSASSTRWYLSAFVCP